MHEKAVEMEKKAEKKLKAFFGGSSKHEEAGEMYNKAANFYKIDRLFGLAAAAYEKAAACYGRTESKHEVVSALVEASTAYKKVSVPNAIRCLEQAIAMELEEGRIQSASRYEKTVAELSESEGNMDAALEHFQRAADLFRGEESQSAASACLLKVATIAAQHKEDFGRASNIFEQLASQSLENHLTKWGARENYLKGGLCRLAMGDPIGARQSIQVYMDQDVSFPDTRECKLLLAVLDAWDKMDAEAFTAAVFEYDQISKLDQWKTQILLKVKNMIKAAENPT
ncbi:putative Alpha-soluble NSF attachment protein [Paratrimastix pyriformis]|uniref:Alpha-soluble NSF attachment protein n=1 Tax=Paratrimastix pyriformis TaxID=342808 RepID=A0ABQ8UKZ0_9EUKA|nr:putative Alpha-soluble NSF attachment protein [Paratrimastix pyriformis]